MNEKSYAGQLAPEFVLLGLLDSQPAHGYELHRRLDQELGEIWRISLSQTYNILNRLEEQGFVRGEQRPQAKRPRREFALTRSGRRRFEQWLAAPCGSSAKAVRVEFLTRLYFTCLRNPEAARRLVAAQADEIRAGIARLQHQAEIIPPSQPINQLGLDLRIRQLNSVLEWLENRCFEFCPPENRNGVEEIPV